MALSNKYTAFIYAFVYETVLDVYTVAILYYGFGTSTSQKSLM